MELSRLGLIGCPFRIACILSPHCYVPSRLCGYAWAISSGEFFLRVFLIIIYAVSVVPIGLLLRAFRKDSPEGWATIPQLQLLDIRHPPGPDPSSLKKQF